MHPEAQEFFKREMVKDVTRRVAPFAKIDQNPLNRELGRKRVSALVALYGKEVKDLMEGVQDGSVKIRDAVARLRGIIVDEGLEKNMTIYGVGRNINWTAESTRNALEGAGSTMEGKQFSDFAWILADINATRRGENRGRGLEMLKVLSPLHRLGILKE